MKTLFYIYVILQEVSSVNFELYPRGSIFLSNKANDESKVTFRNCLISSGENSCKKYLKLKHNFERNY